MQSKNKSLDDLVTASQEKLTQQQQTNIFSRHSKLILILGMALAIIGVGVWVYMIRSIPTMLEISQMDRTQPADSTISPPETSTLPAMQYQYEAELIAVDGSEASGTAWANFSNQYEMMARFVNLPDPEGSDFYEGWIVRSSPLSVLSTGRVEKDETGVYANTFTNNTDLTDHTRYVLTIEPDDGDPAPAGHVVEGDFL